MRDPIRSIYWTTVVLLASLGVCSVMQRTIYFFDAIFFIALATFLFINRKTLIFSWEGFLLSCAGMFMNTAGTLGAYNLSLSGIGWDKFLHFVTSTGIGLLVYAYMNRTARSASKQALSPLALAAITFFIVIGAGAFNEMTEFIGTTYFGFSQGILGMTNGGITVGNDLERFDTQWDLITNAIGALFVVTYMTLSASFRQRSRSGVDKRHEKNEVKKRT